VEKECLGITWRFLRCVRVIMSVMAVFFALFVFDALGDKHGAEESFLIIIAVFAVPLALWACIAACGWHQHGQYPATGSVRQSADVEKTNPALFGGVELKSLYGDRPPFGKNVDIVETTEDSSCDAGGVDAPDNVVFNTMLHASAPGSR
jgi:hypothetical protein